MGDALQDEHGQILASARSNGARIYWITLPPMQNQEFDTQIQMISALQRERVVTGNQILVDVRPALLRRRAPT